ncbi:hypothetical protein Fuma_02832 [Fuerstiella marisgermanici]|uniref:Metallo-beta-lactamase domain-containing protein n=2 Tax=Fuerstiella marisgermanici TaxID=1891926 RepID=A0A1P8WGP4_9PLAN|nr:hypothetical protein Fuma_02832 [Fuerstiella marisgermanici]
MTITIRMFPAGNGDSFLVTGSQDNAFAILIDGGYSATFREHIHPHLKTLSSYECALDLVVATHIDADHISGLISLLRQNEIADLLTPIPIRNIWHNGFRHLAEASADGQELTRAESEILLEIKRKGFAKATEASGAKEEISAHQGSSLGKLIVEGGYPWNDAAAGRAIQAGVLHTIRDAAQIEVIGPFDSRLAELRRWWIRELRSLGVSAISSDAATYSDVFEFICSHERIAGVSVRGIAR